MRPSLPYKIISHVWAFLSLALVCMGCVKDIEIDSKMNQQSKITSIRGIGGRYTEVVDPENFRIKGIRRLIVRVITSSC